MNKRSRLPLALALALGSSTACALGLGQIEVKSALNQPLSAEIPVLSSLAGEADALVVRLAPPEALARVGLPAPSGIAANLAFAVDTNDRGETVIRVTTPDKVNDPFVTFLLEVDWGKGKMLREYTVLLDPPTMMSLRSAPVAATPVVEAEPAAIEPLAEAPPPPSMSEPPVETTSGFEPVPEALPEPAPDASVEPAPVAEAPTPEPSAAPAASARVDTYGPVASGETLWSIAQFARQDDSVSMNQMMLALLYANPDAFVDQNINRLKRGAILRIPGREEALAMAAAEAAAQVREQMQTWRAETAPVMQPAEPETDSTPEPRTVAATPASTDSRLELVPPKGESTAEGAQSGASAAGEGRELRAEVARSREEVGVLSQENVELKSRVGELEKIQADSERLIELKDSELAAAQQRLAELETRAAAATTAAQDSASAAMPPGEAPTASLEPATTDMAATDPGATDATDATDAAASDSATALAAESAPGADATEAAAAATAAATTIPGGPVEVPAVATEAVAESAPVTAAPLPARPAPAPWYLSPWVLGGAALVVVGFLALLLGRRKPAVPAASPAPRYGSGAVAASIAAVQANAAPRAVVAAESDDEADAVAELAEAVAREPANLNRHLDLVRYYYDGGDAAGFEHAAEAMYSRVYDPDNLVWKQVLAMGREIAPEHPLFVRDDFVAPEIAPVVVPVVAVAPVVAPPPSVAREIDWGHKPSAVDVNSTQQMRLDEIDTALETNRYQADPGIQLSVPEIVPSEGIESFGRDNFDSTASDSDAFLDADASSTKLELARAYLDMGDVEGARGMLEEVVSEGNPGQRAEAKRLLDEIR